MPELISHENQDIIARELAARDLSPETIGWAIEELDKTARQFVVNLRKPRSTKRSPETLTRQIEKVRDASEEDRASAVREAVKMGFDRDALELLAGGHPARNLRELGEQQKILDQLDPEYLEPLANRTKPAQRRFILMCLCVWIVTEGRVQFSNNPREDGGPLGRFLTAAMADAYASENLRVPSAEALRKNAKRIEAACDSIAFDWHGMFESGRACDLDLDALDDALREFFDEE